MKRDYTITLIGYKPCTTTVVISSDKYDDAIETAFELAEAGELKWDVSEDITDIDLDSVDPEWSEEDEEEEEEEEEEEDFS